MDYVSTRGGAPALDFEGATLAGLAADGGLYLPREWPRFTLDEIAAMRGLPYPELAARVMHPFVGDSLTPQRLRELCEQAYARFAHVAVTPLTQLDERHWLLELFHGPTLAFKDVALQLLGLLFEEFLSRRDERLTIVGATSGDTGSAAIDAVAGRERIDIFMLHPAGRVSDVQRRQMTTVKAPNVYNIAIGGSFDDAQAMVKRMFGDTDMTGRFRISAVNSINWARLMAQVVYYFAAALQLGGPERKIAFSVPTGNFGNVVTVAGQTITMTDPRFLPVTASVPYTVTPEAATVTYTGDTFVQAGSPITLSATVTQDPDGYPGDITLAQVQFTITSSSGTVVQTVLAPVSAAGTATTTVTLANPDVYTVQAQVVGGWFTSDPSSPVFVDNAPGAVNGTTLVTGGGWVNLAPGAYKTNPAASGRANFGFNVTQAKGKISGNVQFNFSAGGLNFKGPNVTSLSVKQATDTLGGSGTINGSGNYTFQLIVFDGGNTGDTFRLVIKSGTKTVFDSGTLPPVGGNIVIH